MYIFDGDRRVGFGFPKGKRPHLLYFISFSYNNNNNKKKRKKKRRRTIGIGI
jgi:hypothetical protein